MKESKNHIHIHIEDFELAALNLGETGMWLDDETLLARYGNRSGKPRRTAQGLRAYLAEGCAETAEIPNGEKPETASAKAESPDSEYSSAECSKPQKFDGEQGGLSFLVSRTLGAYRDAEENENLRKFITMRHTFRLYDYITHDPKGSKKLDKLKSHIRYMRASTDSQAISESDEERSASKDLFVLVESPIESEGEQARLTTLAAQFAKETGLASRVHVYFLNVPSLLWFGTTPNFCFRLRFLRKTCCLSAGRRSAFRGLSARRSCRSAESESRFRAISPWKVSFRRKKKERTRFFAIVRAHRMHGSKPPSCYGGNMTFRTSGIFPCLKTASYNRIFIASHLKIFLR